MYNCLRLGFEEKMIPYNKPDIVAYGKRSVFVDKSIIEIYEDEDKRLRI